jgi:hypothetical protein
MVEPSPAPDCPILATRYSLLATSVQRLTSRLGVMNAKNIRILSLLGKLSGLALTIAGPFDSTMPGLIVFACASILKDAVNRLGDIFDDGKPNTSFSA